MSAGARMVGGGRKEVQGGGGGAGGGGEVRGQKSSSVEPPRGTFGIYGSETPPTDVFI